MKKILFAACLFSGLLIFCSCGKDGFITSSDASLSISRDSLKFDTVFTGTGSVTRSFKILNDNKQRLRISVQLMGGAASAFKININGVASVQQSGIEIAAEDSIYVFVSVTVNPSAADLPFILSDSIAVNYNGNTRFVQLQAYGQNAVFLRNAVISSNAVFSNTLPYVILGSLQVAAGAMLTIPAGTKIYAHANAPLIIDGTLITNGTADNKVIFSGDRLDEPYDKLPGSWPGIYFRQNSKNSQLNFSVIKNAYQAVAVSDPSVNTNPKLVLRQCIIDNAYDAGLLCSNSAVQADNSLVSNCGTNVRIVLGGNYSFTNCTIASYSNDYILHKFPVLSVANFADVNGSTAFSALSAIFQNCIFWGDNNSLGTELNIQKQGSNAFNISVEHCLYKAEADPGNTSFSNSISNQEPQFDSIDVRNAYYDFRLTRYASPAVNSGVATGFPKDLDDNPRVVGITDIGCYEKQ